MKTNEDDYYYYENNIDYGSIQSNSKEETSIGATANKRTELTNWGHEMELNNSSFNKFEAHRYLMRSASGAVESSSLGLVGQGDLTRQDGVYSLLASEAVPTSVSTQGQEVVSGNPLSRHTSSREGRESVFGSMNLNSAHSQDDKIKSLIHENSTTNSNFSYTTITERQPSSASFSLFDTYQENRGDYNVLLDSNITSGFNASTFHPTNSFTVNSSINDFSIDANVTDAIKDYEYDYSNADFALPLDEIVPVSFVYGSTLMMGVVGNLLVIAAVARDRRLRSITNIFLTSLASADLALLCFCVPVKCAAFFTFTWAFGFFLCKSVHYFQIVAMVCSVMTLTVMSIERNIAILSPLRSKRICTRGRARIVVVLLWASSFVLALPILVGQKHKMVGVKRKAYWCVKEWNKPIYGILFESYMLVLLFMVPVGVMVVSYTTICMELSRGTKFRRQATSTQCTTTYRGYANHKARYSSTKQMSHKGSCLESVLRNRHQERMDQEKMKVIRMLIVVVVLFAICWGPILINNLLVAVDVLDTLHLGALKPLRQAIFILSYLNSSLNPLVYGFMSRHFRRGFREAICVCCSANGRRGGDTRFNRGRRATNLSCYPSEGQASTTRTGTIRLSPVTNQEPVVDEEELDESPVGNKRVSRKVWVRNDRVSQGHENM